MKSRFRDWAILAVVLAVGFAWGRSTNGLVLSVRAQEAEGPSDETQRKIQAANEALKLALDGLKSESLYVPATNGMNVYAVLSGGLDAIDDLESGRGVDPETFAALYADQATDDVQAHLSKDADGRLTYKNKLIRIYPISRLKRLHSRRMVLTGETPATAKSSDE